jgi:putative transcriptional regulator
MKTLKHDRKTPKHDWSRFDAMTDEQAHAAALNDPDAQPLTKTDFARTRPVPRAKMMRRALGLKQEEFAARFQIPLGTLRGCTLRDVPLIKLD